MVDPMLQIDLIKIYERSFRENFELPALTDYARPEDSKTYGDLARDIAKLHLMYQELGVNPGDKIALLGKNCSSWATVFIATVTYGAVIVPVLHEFSADDARNIINHSDAVLLFVSTNLYAPLDYKRMPSLKAALSLETFSLLGSRDESGDEKSESGEVASIVNSLESVMDERYAGGFSADDINYASYPDDHTAEINYTSGTTGNSKGVVLSLGNLGGNVVFGIESRLHYRGSRVLNFLPLAHAYGCAFDMLVPLAVGSHITFLDRQPTPKVLVKAFAEVKPALVLCVPLVLEKIYKRIILPALNRRAVKVLRAIPLFKKIVYRRVCRQLTETFGGEFEEVIVGGAALSAEVERFLKDIGFRFTVGYGMTECAPLISYTPWREFQLGSSGRILPGIMEVKILEDETREGVGEIMVRGVNVMKGYYKRPDLSEEILESDGWLHTGDMGSLGEDGKTIFIKGRYKTMILGPSGQNIYPESIEDRLNSHPYIAESIVVERGGRLNAIVVPDADALKESGVHEDLHHLTVQNAVKEVNKRMGAYERIANVEMRDEPFEKTPKKSIKRYLYR